MDGEVGNVRGWCPKTRCPRTMSERRGVQRHGVRRPRPKDWRIGGRTMSKWTMSQGPRPNVPRTRGPRPKVMAFLNDKLTQCLYKTMLKQQHCTSQGQTVMNWITNGVTTQSVDDYLTSNDNGANNGNTIVSMTNDDGLSVDKWLLFENRVNSMVNEEVLIQCIDTKSEK